MIFFRCLTYVREAAQRAATKSELHKTQIESLLGEKVGLGGVHYFMMSGVFRKVGTLKWVRRSDIAPTGLSKLNSFILTLTPLRRFSRRQALGFTMTLFAIKYEISTISMKQNRRRKVVVSLELNGAVTRIRVVLYIIPLELSRRTMPGKWLKWSVLSLMVSQCLCWDVCGRRITRFCPVLCI